jgi:hypothetical protein
MKAVTSALAGGVITPGEAAMNSVQTNDEIYQVTGTSENIKKSCHTGERRCPWQKWVPAFRREDEEGAVGAESSKCV